MILLVVCCVLLPAFCSATDFGAFCNSPECDPSHEPVENIFTAMTGYDILKGNPFSDSRRTDPGFNNKEYIFVPTVKNAEKRYGLDDGLTVRRVKNCDLQITSEVMSNSKDYQKQLTKSMSSGSQLATGLEYEVSAGVSAKGVDLGISTTVPPLASSAFSANNEFKKNEQFFTSKTGIVSVAGAVCSSYTMTVSQTTPPKFHPGFVKMLFRLQAATDDRTKKSEFNTFIEAFGTHYLKFVEMGSRIAITKRYTREQAMKTTLEDMKDCTSESLSLFFGLVKSQSSKCTKTSESSTSTLYNEYSKQYITTYGSAPDKDLISWSKQKFDSPLPIRMTLDPIVNLFREVFMSRVKDEKKNPLKYKDIIVWLLPKYIDYCKDNKDKLGVGSCEVADLKAKGCGWNDDCEFDQKCKNDKSKPEGYICENQERTFKAIVKTTDRGSGGTDAAVKMMVYDTSGASTDTINLNNPSNNDDPFEQGDEDKFTFKSKKRLGTLRNIRIWHNDSGSKSGWHLSWVKIRDVMKERDYKFVCDRWLATDEGDKKIDIECYEESLRSDWNSKKKADKAKKAKKAKNILKLGKNGQ